MNPIELVNRMYSTGEVVRLTGITGRQLQYWDSISFFSPSYKKNNRRIYSFTDLIQLTVISLLLSKGATLQKIKNGMEKMREILPSITVPFLELEIDTDGESIFVHHKDTWLEAHSGQYMISFKVEDIFKDIRKLMEEQDVLAALNQNKSPGELEAAGKKVGS